MKDIQGLGVSQCRLPDGHNACAMALCMLEFRTRVVVLGFDFLGMTSLEMRSWPGLACMRRHGRVAEGRFRCGIVWCGVVVIGWTGGTVPKVVSFLSFDTWP
jgi:hypothetical protein